MGNSYDIEKSQEFVVTRKFESMKSTYHVDSVNWLEGKTSSFFFEYWDVVPQFSRNLNLHYQIC